MSAAAERHFRIARNPDVPRAEMGYARRYERIEDAVADMGDGVVFEDSSGEIVAFHERHARWIEHRARRSGSARMTFFAAVAR